MRRSFSIPFALAAVFMIGLVAPAAVGARTIDEKVTFISRAELQRQGLLTPARSTRATSPIATKALCLWDCIHIRNTRYLRTLRPFVTMVQGTGPVTIAIDIARTVKNSFSATVSLSAEVVSAGVGFNVERAETVTYRSSTTVPNGACWTLRAYNVFYEYGFEVWQEPFIGSDTKIGAGSARDFRGIEFRLTKAC